MFNMSSIFFPSNLISKIESLNLLPLQLSHLSFTSAMNCISIVTIPSPLQLGHLPPSTLNEKCLG